MGILTFFSHSPLPFTSIPLLGHDARFAYHLHETKAKDERCSGHTPTQRHVARSALNLDPVHLERSIRHQPHFTDEETEARRSSGLPNVTHQQSMNERDVGLLNRAHVLSLIFILMLSRLVLPESFVTHCSPPGSSVHGISRQEYWSGLPFPSPSLILKLVKFQ